MVRKGVEELELVRFIEEHHLHDDAVLDFDNLNEPLQEIARLVHEALLDFDAAIRKQAIYPQRDYAEFMCHKLFNLGLDIIAGGAIYKEAGIFDKDKLDIIDKSLGLLSELQRELFKRTSLFNYMYENISKHIELEILQNNAYGKRIYLETGKLILPVANPSLVYLVLEISTKPLPDGKKGILFTPKREQTYQSIDEAIQRVPKNFNGTVALARNTEGYPLFETSLPIISQKYLHILQTHA